MLGLHRRATLDPALVALLHQTGENIQGVARLLRDLLVDYPERAALISDVKSA